MIQLGYAWADVFMVYFLVALVSSFLVLFIDDYDNQARTGGDQDALYKLNAAWRLFRDVSKMFYYDQKRFFILSIVFFLLTRMRKCDI